MAPAGPPFPTRLSRARLRSRTTKARKKSRMAARECSSMNLLPSEATHVSSSTGPRGVAGNGARSPGETAGSPVPSPPSTRDEPVSADGPFIQGTRAADLPLILTADEAAGLLRVDRKTVYGLIARG